MESWLTNESAPVWDLLKGNRVTGTLPQSFFERSTLTVAQELLGKLIVVRTRSSAPLESPQAFVTAGRIVETEAYYGADPASHASRGKTPRCAVMFGEAGIAYVYFIYGMYEMLNFVTEGKGIPGAVLIRAVEPVLGIPLMQKRRKQKSLQTLTNGPGRLSQALGIRLSHKGQPLTGPALFVAEDGSAPQKIMASPRVGIRLGQEHFWRFFIEGNPFVSKTPQNTLAREVHP